MFENRILRLRKTATIIGGKKPRPTLVICGSRHLYLMEIDTYGLCHFQVSFRRNFDQYYDSRGPNNTDVSSGHCFKNT